MTIASHIDFRGPPEGFVTQANTPLNVVLFELTEHATSVGRLMIVARRPSDAASKGWDISTLQRRDNGTPVNLGTANGAPFGAALDLTALVLVTIAFFTDGVNVGVTLNPGANVIEWGIEYDGIQMID